MTRLFWLDVWPCFGGENDLQRFGVTWGPGCLSTWRFVTVLSTHPDHWNLGNLTTLQNRKKKREQIVIHQLKRPNPVYIALVGCLEPRRCEGIGRSRSHTWWGTHLGFDVFLFFFVSRFCFTAEAFNHPVLLNNLQVFFFKIVRNFVSFLKNAQHLSDNLSAPSSRGH